MKKAVKQLAFTLLTSMPFISFGQYPSITSTSTNEIRLGTAPSSGNQGIFKLSIPPSAPAKELGLYTYADANPIRIGGNLVKFIKENNGTNDIYASGRLGIGIVPTSSYVLDVVGQSKFNGVTYQYGNLGIFNSSPTCALDIFQGNLIPNVAQIIGLTTSALVNISSIGSTSFPATKTGLFVNRTEFSDPNTSGAEIHGQTSGVITDAVLFSTGNTTGTNSQAIGGGSGTAKGVFAKGASGLNGISYGVDAQANGQGSLQAYGVKGYAWSNNNSASNIYGIYGTVAYTGTGSPSLYAGYFAGDVYCTGSYLPSDRKLKTNISELESTLDKVMLLKPSSYNYDHKKYSSMNLPEGKRFGFIAEELESIFPLLTKKSLQPEKRDENGNLLSEVLEFTAVNYVELIPILTKAIQEQQAQIENQQAQIKDLKKLVTQNSSTSRIDEANTIDAYLMQNTPNPFSNNTEIKYQLPKTIQTAMLGIYDLNGKQVKMYPINTENNTGTVKVSAGELQAGMYIYTLILDGKAFDSKRMVLTAQ